MCWGKLIFHRLFHTEHYGKKLSECYQRNVRTFQQKPKPLDTLTGRKNVSIGMLLLYFGLSIKVDAEICAECYFIKGVAIFKTIIRPMLPAISCIFYARLLQKLLQIYRLVYLWFTFMSQMVLLCFSLFSFSITQCKGKKIAENEQPI